jgi:hypothetical protein
VGIFITVYRLLVCMHVLSTSHFNRYRWIPALLKCAIQEVGVTARVTLDLGRPTASTPNGNCKLMSPTSRDRAVTLGSQRLQRLVRLNLDNASVSLLHPQLD